MKSRIKSILSLVLTSILMIVSLFAMVACGLNKRTLTFYVDDRVFDRLTVEKNELQMPTKNPTKNGYVFEGWYFDKNYKESFDISDTNHNDKDISVYSKWRANMMAFNNRLEINPYPSENNKMIASFQFVIYNKNEIPYDNSIEVWYSDNKVMDDLYVMIAQDASETKESEQYPKFKQVYNVTTELGFLARMLYCEVRFVPAYNLNEYNYYIGKSQEAYEAHNMELYKKYLEESKSCYTVYSTKFSI